MAHGSILGQTSTIDTSTLVTHDSLTNTLNNYVTTSALNSRLNNYATTASLNNYLLRSGGTMTGRLNMGNNKITNLANGTADTDAATVGQLNAAVASSGPQYNYPTGNKNFDFCGLFVILQRGINSSTRITPAESNCFNAAYEYVYYPPSIGSEMLLVQGAGTAFRIVYTSSGWEMSSIDKASRGEVFFIAGPYFG